MITSYESQAQYSAISKYLQTHFPIYFSANYQNRIQYLTIVKSVINNCAIKQGQGVKSLLDVCQRLLEYMWFEFKNLQLQQQQTLLPPIATL